MLPVPPVSEDVVKPTTSEVTASWANAVADKTEAARNVDKDRGGFHSCLN